MLFRLNSKSLTKEVVRLRHHFLMGSVGDHRAHVQVVPRDAIHRFMKENYPPAGVLPRFTHKKNKRMAHNGRMPGK